MAEKVFALRGSKELSIIKCTGDGVQKVVAVLNGASRVMTFSDDGALFALCDGKSVQVLSGDAFTTRYSIPRQRTSGLRFSPKGTFLATWEPFLGNLKPDDKPHENLEIWNAQNGELVQKWVQKKQFDWCPQWSKNEKICARNVNNEILFYEDNKFNATANKLHMAKVNNYLLAERDAEPFYVAVHVPGSKGQPSFVRIFQYPNFGGLPAALASKSFYKAETADLLWNKKGTALLIHTATESSAASYYGEQGLHYVDVRGESCLVPRAKEGPVYSVAWSPLSTEFCVVYGCMPAKATIYNLKCEPVFDFGTGPRNLVYYNPQGNVVCLAGFGNLRGNVEMWDMSGSRKLISNPQAIDTTQFEWCPDGHHYMTATTSPRLRIGNGFKVWNFYGALLYSSPSSSDELYEVAWRPCSEGVFPEPEVRVVAAKASAPAAAAAVAPAPQQQAQPKAYVPPALRGQPQLVNKPRYKEAYEPDSTTKQLLAENKEPSKAALKNKKKREAKARKKQDGQQHEGDAEQLDTQMEKASLG